MSSQRAVACWERDSDSFNTTGQKIDADAGNVGVSSEYSYNETYDIIAQLDTEFSPHYNSYSGQIVFKYNF